MAKEKEIEVKEKEKEIDTADFSTPEGMKKFLDQKAKNAKK